LSIVSPLRFVSLLIRPALGGKVIAGDAIRGDALLPDLGGRDRCRNRGRAPGRSATMEPRNADGASLTIQRRIEARPGGHRFRPILVLIGFLALAFAVAAGGSLATIANVEGWYSQAEKAPWSPPNWVFAPAWTVLYSLMSIAAWLVWREGDGGDDTRGRVRPALMLYFGQLALNAIWTPIFFGLYPTIGAAALWLALIVIVLLDVAVPLTILAFRRVDRVASWLLVPYWIWLLFATTLNLAVAVLN
jgi:tryptophan-rich sensory protein